MVEKFLHVAALALVLLAQSASAQISICEDPSTPPPSTPVVALQPQEDPATARLMRIIAAEREHRLYGLASYYSTSLDGTLTANGEIYRNKRHSAAHLTLPLGTWVEVRSRASGKRIRLRVNDRGPYAKKFIIDLSRSAARALRVDVAEDRTVFIRILALPGEAPLPDDLVAGPPGVIGEEGRW